MKAKMIAHRGYSKFELENTAPAFISAGVKSFYGTECDVHKTLDNQFVICHDDNISRISGIDLFIKDARFDDLARVNLNDITKDNFVTYYHIIKLSDYIEINARYHKHCVIELKDVFTRDDLKEIIKIIQSFNYLENCSFISFISSNLFQLRDMGFDNEMMVLITEFKDEYLTDLIKYSLGIDILYKNVSKTLVDLIHSNHLKVNVWTVNDELEVKELDAMGVDYITTNWIE